MDDATLDHILNHRYTQAGCDHCAVRPLLTELHQVWSTAPAPLVALIYAENDAYGPVGTVPPQGYDWSGIRDSSPAAIRRMIKLVHS